MVKRLREDPSGGAGTWVRGTSTLPKDSWELDETWKEPTLGSISSDEFRNKKSKWKRKFYTPYTTYEERVSHRPHQLSQQEWVQLVEFWDTPEHQAISERNKANRAKQIAKHAAGRISFPQFEEIMSEEHGTPPSLGDLFVRTHTSSKTHDALDDQLRDYIVNDLENQVVEMKRVAEEKEEERQREIEEMRRQAQDKDKQREREMDEMKRQFDARDADMEAGLMQKLLEMTTTRSRLSSN
ncbi:hypothetical protein IFM89_009531 [Coptis chinensis]|uniref:Uncharacterized protein n=1 Tax=Coptis chinensis TaxID=261450 RepID=A0A835LRF1_9MAGN|nr:hypothetical protein IFM89_009531 [Coptis chinensis]